MKTEKIPGFAAGDFLLYSENHSLGEWFQRSLVAMMKEEKLPLL